MSSANPAFDLNPGDGGMVGLSPLDYLNYYMNGEREWTFPQPQGEMRTDFVPGTIPGMPDDEFNFE